MQGLGTTITLVFAVMYIVAPDFWNRLLGLPTVLMAAMFGQLLFEPALNFWMVRQRYEYCYRGVVTVTLFNSLASTVIGILCVMNTIEKGVARILVYAIIQTGVGVIFYIYHLVKGKHYFSKQYWKFALKFNIPLIPHYLSYSILNQADRLMIGSMVGTGEAAIYSVAYTIAMMMQIVTQAIANSLTPYTYQSLKNKNYNNLKKCGNILLLMMGIVCVIVMLFAPEVLRLFASVEYISAVYVMPPVVASTFFLFLYPLFSNIEFYFEKTKFIMVASSSGAVVNIILNYIFIPIYGYYAAGFTTLFCYILFSIAHYYFYKRIMRQELPEVGELYDIKTVISISMIILVCTIGSMFLYSYTVVRYTIILVLIVGMILKKDIFVGQLESMKK
jgi:O-antigen/teichoic acid export membrane protein